MVVSNTELLLKSFREEDWMDTVTVRTVLGEERVFDDWHSVPGLARHSWKSKLATENCAACPHCVNCEQAIAVIRQLNATKGRRHWTPPSGDRIAGLCLWGKCPKILIPGGKRPRKCQFFGKPRPEPAHFSW